MEIAAGVDAFELARIRSLFQAVKTRLLEAGWQFGPDSRISLSRSLLDDVPVLIVQSPDRKLELRGNSPTEILEALEGALA